MNAANHLTSAALALRFDAARHAYFIGGIELPSVTQILKACHITQDWDRLVDEGKIHQRDLDEKRDIGRAAHLAAHYYDDGTLARETVDPRVDGYLQAWIDFRRNTGFTPAILETPLWHPTLYVAGTQDRAGFFASFLDCDPCDLYHVDIKCGDPDDAGAEWQTAAYAELLSVCLEPSSPLYDPLNLRLRPTYSVRLQDNGRYKLTRYPETLRRWGQFTHFLDTFRCQHGRRHEVVRV